MFIAREEVWLNQNKNIPMYRIGIDHTGGVLPVVFFQNKTPHHNDSWVKKQSQKKMCIYIKDIINSNAHVSHSFFHMYRKTMESTICPEVNTEGE